MILCHNDLKIADKMKLLLYGIFQEPEKSAETMVLSQGPGSSATSTSSSGKLTTITSFDATQTGNGERSLFNLAPPDLLNQRTSSRTEAHPNGIKNIKNRPRLPDSKRSSRHHINNNNNINIYEFNEQIKRSVSTRELRHMDRNRLLELHAVD